MLNMGLGMLLILPAASLEAARTRVPAAQLVGRISAATNDVRVALVDV